jgi:hypothetical protein
MAAQATTKGCCHGGIVVCEENPSPVFLFLPTKNDINRPTFSSLPPTGRDAVSRPVGHFGGSEAADALGWFPVTAGECGLSHVPGRRGQELDYRRCRL